MESSSVILIKQLDFLGYSKYAVRSDGAVLNIDRVCLLKPDVNHSGYLRVFLYADDGSTKKESVHRLVALSWLDNPENKPSVNHIDNNPSNNALSNLEWATHKENTSHMLSQGRRGAPNAKLTEAGIALIKNGTMTLKALSETLGVSKQTVLYWRRKDTSVFIKD